MHKMELTSEQVIKMVEDIAETKQLVKDILVQTTKTNGQVKTNTAWIAQHQGAHAAFMVVAGVIGGTLGAILTAVLPVIVSKIFKI